MASKCKEESRELSKLAQKIEARRINFAFSGKKVFFGVLSAAIVGAIFGFVLMGVDIFFDPFNVYQPEFSPSPITEIIGGSSLFQMFICIIVFAAVFFFVWNGFFFTRKRFSISFSIVGTAIGAVIFGFWIFSGNRSRLTGMQIFTPALVLMSLGCFLFGLIFAFIMSRRNK